MTFAEYQDLMRRTYKTDRAPNHALGLSGEASEIAEQFYQAFDAMRAAGSVCERVKKDVYHKKPLDKAALADELGDLQWYISAVANDYDLSLDDIAQRNIDKLRKRYPEGFVPGGGIR